MRRKIKKKIIQIKHFSLPLGDQEQAIDVTRKMVANEGGMGETGEPKFIKDKNKC
jgi:hypothetical protein